MSLRRRVLLGCVVVAAVLLVADFALMSTFRGYLVGRVDEQLAHTATRFASLVSGQRLPGLDPGHTPPPQVEPEVGHVSEFYLAFADPDAGTLTRVDIPLRDNPTPPEPAPEEIRAHTTAAGEPVRPFTVAGDSGWRVVAFQVPPAARTAVVGASLEEVGSIYRRMLGVLAVATVAVLATLAVAVWWVLRQGVRPLTAMTATAQSIADGALHERVTDVDERTEAGRLGAALNRMLGRIQTAFDQRAASEERLRRFAADASHELRTPLTSIRGYGELHRAGGLADPGALEDAMRRIEQEADRMGALVEDLLLLARFDQGRPVNTRPVDLAVITADAVADLRAVEPGRRVTVHSEETTLLGDDPRLRHAVANLLANTRVHTPPGTPVHVRVHREDGWAAVEVADEGPGMPPEVADRVFERFYRADPARARKPKDRAADATGAGSGLGLAIVASIVSAHGGDVAVDTAPGQGARFRLRLPLAGDHADRAAPAPADG